MYLCVYLVLSMNVSLFYVPMCLFISMKVRLFYVTIYLNVYLHIWLYLMYPGGVSISIYTSTCILYIQMTVYLSTTGLFACCLNVGMSLSLSVCM